MSSPLLFSYYKVTDPAHWINVDKNTGQLRVANTIDRESKFVYNAMYNVTMKAVDASEFTSLCFLNFLTLKSGFHSLLGRKFNLVKS